LNEHITGDPWPDREQRDLRGEECADFIQRLLGGAAKATQGSSIHSGAQVLPELAGVRS